MSFFRCCRRPTLLALAAALGACSETPTANQDPVPTTVHLSANAVEFLALGDTLRLIATVLDQNGGVMQGVPVSWTSSSTSVVTVSGAGLVTAVADGDADVTAAAAGVTGVASVEVRQTPDHVRFDPEVVVLEGANDTVTVRATVVDANMNELPGQAITWSAQDGGVLEVDAEGVVTALADGATRILATVDALVGELSAFVGEQQVIIESVAPAVLLADSIATVRGLGFSQEVDGNVVTLDGAEAEVVFATSTTLRFRVPSADCSPAHTGTVRVEAFGLSGTSPAEVRPVSHRLEVGEGVWTGDGCLHLAGGTAAGERYMIGILSASEVVSSLTPAALEAQAGDEGVVAAPDIAGAAARTGGGAAHGGRGSWGALAGGGWFRVPAESPVAGRQGRTAAPSAPPSAIARALAPSRVAARTAERRAEASIRAAERRLWDGLARTGIATAARARGAPNGPSAVVPSTGDTLRYTVPTFGEDTFCTGGTEVEGVVRYVGDGAVFVDDVDNPTAGFGTAEYRELDDLLAESTLPVITAHFGEISDVDDNEGRIVVLITKEVNGRENLRGFVFSGDLATPAQCADSNQAEIFYGIAPDPDGVHGDVQSVADVLDSYPTLIAHELTHIAQFANLRAGKAIWELEGGATLAEQLVGFRVHGHGPRQDLGAAEWVASLDDGGWYGDWVFDLALYFGFRSNDERVEGAPEECSWVEREEAENDGPCENGRAVYGVPSTLLRFVLDEHGGAYPGGDAALMRHMTSSRARGLETLGEATGEEPVSILTRFAVTLWADGRVGNWLQSWNITDIFENAGLQPTTRLEPYLSSAAEPSLDVDVRASSNAYLEWRPPPPHEPTSLRILTPGGDPLPDHMVLWILRIR